MKYPYIGKGSLSEAVFLFFNTGEALTLDFGKSNYSEHEKNIREDVCRNITTEYLANTYGEVKSKEHAEFIVRLAEVNDVAASGCANTENAKWFSFRVDKGIVKLTFLSLYNSLILDEGRKQITIPLPPECESVDEWPKVGEIVLTASKSKAKVLAIHNKKAWVEYVSGTNGFNTLNIASLSKPKTPEQELRDGISDLAFNQFNDDSYDLTHNSYYLAEQLISKYNITKKGKGDE